jgi:cell division protein FtsN
MAQDFAKQRTPPAPPGKSGRGTTRTEAPSRWNWFLSGLIVGILTTAGSYIGVQYYQSRNPGVLDIVEPAPTPESLPAFDFGFYDELASAEVAVTDPQQAQESSGSTDQGESTGNPPPPSANLSQQDQSNYLLQAGSFQVRQEAEERRAKIMLLNMTADVVPGIVAGRTWYRVQVGPYAGREHAEEARRSLSANNIDSIPLLVR